ncbi:MAG: WD40/YVTN/BNR-like repeat-containing protein, partial [Acidobacteriota bacterium]
MRLPIMFLISIFFLSTSVTAQWTQANGPFGGRIRCLNSFSNDSGQTSILAGTDGGLFTSTDNGLSWKSKTTGMPGHSVRCITVNGNKIFAGTNSGIFTSEDNCETWKPINGENIFLDVTSILVSGTNVLVGQGFYELRLSTNSGATWKYINHDYKWKYDVRALAQIDTVFFMASFRDGVFRSTDKGNTWSIADTGLSDLRVLTLIAAPNTSGGKTLFVGTYNGIFASTNNGETWSTINHGMENIITLSIAAHGKTLYAGSYRKGIYISTDNGANWINHSNGLSSLTVRDISIKGDSIFAATEDGIFVSSDNGTLWQPANGGLHAHSILSMASIGNDLFAATETGGVFLSSDKGESWKAVNKGLKDKCINALAAMGDELFAGSDTSGFFKSTDHGLNWREINYGSPKYFNHDSYWSITALAASGSNLVACATGGMGIYVSTDRGENWFYAKTDSMFEPNPRILAVMGNTVFTANQHGEIHISNDNGLSWKKLNSVIPDAYINDMAILDSTLFVASDYKTIRTTDSGSTWSDVIVVPGKRWQYSFAVYQNYIYAGTDEGEIYLSANNGTSWLKVASGMPAPIKKLFIHNGNFYAATTGNGVWKYPLQEIISSIKEP